MFKEEEKGKGKFDVAKWASTHLKKTAVIAPQEEEEVEVVEEVVKVEEQLPARLAGKFKKQDIPQFTGRTKKEERVEEKKEEKLLVAEIIQGVTKAITVIITEQCDTIREEIQKLREGLRNENLPSPETKEEQIYRALKAKGGKHQVGNLYKLFTSAGITCTTEEILQALQGLYARRAIQTDGIEVWAD